MKFGWNQTTQVTIAILVLVSTVIACEAANMVTSGEMRAKAKWVFERLQDPKPPLPFSLIYDGRHSDELLGSWKKSARIRQLTGDRTERTCTWTDPKTGLQVRCIAIGYGDYPVSEWTIYLKNTGKSNTPIIESIQGLDARFDRKASDPEFVLNGIKGDFCTADSYEPFTLTMGPDFTKKFAPPEYSGKSSDGPDGWPYWNLRVPGGGVILACGWPGQWQSTFSRDAGNSLRVKVGQQLTRLYLKPGEEIRTPLIAMLFWQGKDVVRAQNIWRRWYMTHVIPKVNGKRQPPITQIQVSGSVDTKDVERYLEAGIKPDICWRDAGWYPTEDGPYKGGDAWLNTGTWEVDKTRYPNGFRPFSDKVRAQEMQFLLWFEPERVGDPNSWLGKNHPEWILPRGSAGDILDEGNPEAWKWLVDHIDGMIKSQGLDWYREDMNGEGPAPAWRKHDAEDRQGITENFYVQGHLAFWDELKHRNPGLHIDSCASGGRRNDLETMRRAVPLLRSDYQFPSQGDVAIGNQGHTYGLSSWLPYYGTGVYGIETYKVRSFLVPAFGVIPPRGWESADDTRAATKRAYDEARKVAPLMLGDYYPLTEYSLDTGRWIAWQFSRPEQGDGFVQAFRRENCDDSTVTYRLNGLSSKASYQLTDFDSPNEKQVISGKDLMTKGLTIDVKDKPGAAIITYKKVK